MMEDIPSDGRWTMREAAMVASLFLLSLITYVDRAAVATAREPISTDLGLSEAQMGFVFSAFALGYAAGQVPCGWLADRWGARAVLSCAVAVWSLLTSLTGLAWSFASLALIRLLFGMGEAAVFPGCARAIRDWLSSAQRGRANGALFAGSRIGAALSFPLLVVLVQRLRWRVGFLLLGMLGIMWALGWWLWFRDPLPRLPVTKQSGGPRCEARYASGASTQTIVKLLTQYFASNFTNFICLSWMFPYLKARYGLSSEDAAWCSMPPLLLGATALGLTGMLVDRMYVSRLMAWSRRTPCIIGFGLAAIGLTAVTQTRSLSGAVAAFSLAVFGADMTVGPSWVVCADIGAERTGRLSGAMNTIGSIGAFVSANAFPLLHRISGSSSPYFFVAAGLNILGLLCWMSLRSVNVNGERSAARQAEFA